MRSRYCAALIFLASSSMAIAATPTVGGGTLSNPAIGPGPAYNSTTDNFTLVKNWDFGANGTIQNQAQMNAEFQYHDEFNTYNNGNGNYGANIVAPDAANAIYGQPVQDASNPVRSFTSDSLKTYLVPLNGATTVSPSAHNVGSGSFQAKWTLPAGGSILAQDVLWETRVRYTTPKYFWFALWTAGNKWDQGAEMDTVESFGYQNPDGATNYNGQYWHSGSVGGVDQDAYANWNNSMTAHGIKNFDATAYHTWSWLYKKDNTYVVYLDGIAVQSGKLNWTLGGVAGGEPLNMSFIFDASWGHTQVQSVDKSLAASELAGTDYEFDYSRVFLAVPEPASLAALGIVGLLALRRK